MVMLTAWLLVRKVLTVTPVVTKLLAVVSKTKTVWRPLKATSKIWTVGALLAQVLTVLVKIVGRVSPRVMRRS
jgi:hypothetical protein